MQLIENIKGSPVICQSGPQSPPRGRWMFLFLVYREGVASETLKRLTPKLEALRLEVSSKSARFPLSEAHAQLTKQAVLGEAQVLSSAMTMTHCEEVTPPAPKPRSAH